MEISAPLWDLLRFGDFHEIWLELVWEFPGPPPLGPPPITSLGSRGRLVRVTRPGDLKVGQLVRVTKPEERSQAAGK